MIITLDLQPEIESGLAAQATARGVSLADYVREIVVREAHVSQPAPRRHTGQDLIDVCDQVHGLADDLDTTRNPSFGRQIDLS